MWLAVSDTSPINYLLQIGEIEAMQRLYGRVVLPSAVVSELLHHGSPAIVRHWAAHPPKWVEVRTPVGDPDVMQANLGAENLFSASESTLWNLLRPSLLQPTSTIICSEPVTESCSRWIPLRTP
jgi:predicted nucleic acid-binding protein